MRPNLPELCPDLRPEPFFRALDQIAWGQTKQYKFFTQPCLQDGPPRSLPAEPGRPLLTRPLQCPLGTSTPALPEVCPLFSAINPITGEGGEPVQRWTEQSSAGTRGWLGFQGGAESGIQRGDGLLVLGSSAEGIPTSCLDFSAPSFMFPPSLH